MDRPYKRNLPLHSKLEVRDCQKSVFDSLSMKIYDFHRICSPLQRTNFVSKICTFAV